MKKKGLKFFLCYLSVVVSSIIVSTTFSFSNPTDVDKAYFEKIIENLANKNLSYLDTLERKMETFTFSNPDEGIRILNRILSNEWALANDKIASRCFYWLSRLYYSINRIHLASRYLFRCLNLLDYNEDRIAYFWLTNDIGNLFYRIQELDSAIRYYQISGKGFAEALANNSFKDKKSILYGISTSLENIAMCNVLQGEIEKAIVNYKESLRYRQQIADEIGIQYATTKLGKAYILDKQFDSALYYLRKSFDFEIGKIKNEFQLVQYNDYKSQALVSISNIYYMRNNLDLAEHYFDSASKSLEKNNNIYSLFNFYIDAANFYLRHKDLQRAEKNANRAFDYAKMNNSTPNFAVAAKLLYDISMVKKDYVAALKYLDMAYIFLDSSAKVSDLMAIELSKLSSDLENKIYDVQKLISEKKIEEQRIAKLWILVISLIVTLSLMGIILYNIDQKRKLSKKMNKTLTEKNDELNNIIQQLEESKTELKAANEQLTQTNIELEKSNDAKNKLFSIIAHDLRNLAGPLKNTSNLIVEEYNSFDEQQRQQFFTLMNDSANRLNSLLQNLLIWASALTQNITINKDRVNLRALANNAIDLYSISAQEKSIDLINRIPETIEVVCDINMISTVFRNLLHNAIKFTEENGRVEVTAVQDDSAIVKIAISDNGVGMDPETARSIFSDAFFQSSFGTKGEKGTGLGWRICKEFIQLHNGDFWFESKLHSGTTAYFTLPQ